MYVKDGAESLDKGNTFSQVCDQVTSREVFNDYFLLGATLEQYEFKVCTDSQLQ